jgi:hypothetical protein
LPEIHEIKSLHFSNALKFFDPTLSTSFYILDRKNKNQIRFGFFHHQISPSLSLSLFFFFLSFALMFLSIEKQENPEKQRARKTKKERAGRSAMLRKYSNTKIWTKQEKGLVPLKAR